MTIRGVSFAKLNFAENAPRLKMPLNGQPFTMDMTDKFLKFKIGSVYNSFLRSENVDVLSKLKNIREAKGYSI